MGNDIKNQTEFASKLPKQFDPSVRWFYCTKTLSSNTPHNKEDYIQFRFDISSLIEEHYLSGNVFISKVNNFQIIPSYKEGEKHLLTKLDNTAVQKEVKRINVNSTLPKDINVINKRYSKEFPVELIMDYEIFPNAYANQMCFASYKKIFENINYNKDDPFLKNFMNFSILTERKFALYLQNDFIHIISDQLEKHIQSSTNSNSKSNTKTVFHNVLSFESFYKLLSINFKSATKHNLTSYIKYYLNKSNLNEFNDIIIQMFKEDGHLYKEILKMVKNKSYKQNPELVLYYLCLLYALNETTIKSNKTTVYLYIDNKQENKYIKGSKYFLNEMLICRSKPKPINTDNNTTKQYLQIEIQCQNDSLIPMKYPFLSKFPYDLGNTNIYGNDEILLPSNIVLKCNGYLNEHSVQFELISNILEEQVQCMNDREKNNFLIWDDMSYVSINYLYNEKEVYSITKFTKFRQKNLKFAKKFETFSHSLESIDCFGAEMTLDNLKTIMNLFNKNGQCKIQFLDLSGNDIGKSGLIEINKVLPNMKDTLVTINLSYNIINDESIKEINFEYCENLKYLILKENHLNQDGVSYIASNFKYLKKLIVLDLYGNRVEDKGAESIAQNIEQLENLGKIDLCNSFIGDKGIEELLVKIKLLFNTLRWINLKQNVFGKDKKLKDICIQLIETLNHIEYFNIDQNKFSEGDVHEIQKAFNNKRKDIDYNNNNKVLTINKKKNKCVKRNVSELKITSPQMFDYFIKHIHEYIDNIKCLNFSEYDQTQDIALQHIKQFIYYDNQFKHLKTLNLSYSNISASSLNLLLSSLSHFDNLTELYLDSIGLNNKAKEFSQNMYQLCRIEKLSLCYNELDEYFIMEALENFSFLLSIEYIDLYGNKINSNGMKLFCMGLKAQNNINYLNLGNNLIGNEGVVYLIECFKYLSKLNWLDLSSNYFSDEAMKMFIAKSSYLLMMKNFDIRNNLISQKTMNIILAQGIPDYFMIK
jgi:Ran GTPase-activating protein (RanGAP) involved in mRNA processing and transport